jgi:hypothetical protein
MKAGPPNDRSQDAHLDANDPVWRLLGQASLPEPDGWFTARTLARCRNDEPAVAKLPVRIWRWALGGGLAVSMAVAFAVTQQFQVQTEQVNKQKDVQAAFEIMASVDNDQDSTSSTWQDSSL